MYECKAAATSMRPRFFYRDETHGTGTLPMSTTIFFSANNWVTLRYELKDSSILGWFKAVGLHGRRHTAACTRDKKTNSDPSLRKLFFHGSRIDYRDLRSCQFGSCHNARSRPTLFHIVTVPQRRPRAML